MKTTVSAEFRRTPGRNRAGLPPSAALRVVLGFGPDYVSRCFVVAVHVQLALLHAMMGLATGALVTPTVPQNANSLHQTGFGALGSAFGGHSRRGAKQAWLAWEQQTPSWTPEPGGASYIRSTSPDSPQSVGCNP